MARLIHYKVKTNHYTPASDGFGGTLAGPGLISADHNDIIGGNGPLPKKGIPLLTRKLARKHNVRESQIVICNIVTLTESE